jgi:hypothetical protein
MEHMRIDFDKTFRGRRKGCFGSDKKACFSRSTNVSNKAISVYRETKCPPFHRPPVFPQSVKGVVLLRPLRVDSDVE